MNSLPLAGKKIMIDPGHGGRFQGAIGQTGLKEKDVNLDVSLELHADLVELGAEVRMTRTTDTEVLPGGSLRDDLQARCTPANAWPADIFISVHSNSNTNRQVNGTEVYHARAASPRSKVLGRLIHQRMVDELKLKDNGVRASDFYVLKNTDMPAVLVETAYISHAGDEAKLADETFREEAAHSIARGVADYFRVESEIRPDPPRQGNPGEGDLLAPGDPAAELHAAGFLLAGAR